MAKNKLKVNVSGLYRSGSTLIYAVTKFMVEYFDLNIKVDKRHFFDPKYDKIIYSYRDIRDIVVSLMEMHGQKFNKFRIEGKGLGQFLDTLISWDNQWRAQYAGRCLELRFEDDVQPNDIRALLDKIIDFLELGHIRKNDNYEEFVRKCYDRFHVSVMQEKQKSITKFVDKYQYHSNHISRGGTKSGKWREQLSDDQQDKLMKMGSVQDFLRKHKYEL